MRISVRWWTLLFSLAVGPVLAQTRTAVDERPITAQHAMVVSIHHCATDAGVAVLRQGGNAVELILLHCDSNRVPRCMVVKE